MSSSLVFGRRGEEVAARIDEVGRAVEAPDVPRRLGADAVAAGHEVAVGDGVRRLLELPEVLRQARDRGRRVEDDLGAVEAQQARAFGEVAVVADVDADRRVARLEDRVAKVARLEEVLLPEPAGVRDVVLAVLAQVAAVGVDDCGGVVVDAGLLTLVDGHDHRHLVLARVGRHRFGGRAGHGLGQVVPVRVLRRTEVGPVEHFLQAEDLHATTAGLLDERDVRGNRGVAHLGDRHRWIGDGRGRLNQAAADVSGHGASSDTTSRW